MVSIDCCFSFLTMSHIFLFLCPFEIADYILDKPWRGRGCLYRLITPGYDLGGWGVWSLMVSHREKDSESSLQE